MWQKLKNLWKGGLYKVTTGRLKDLTEHPRFSVDPAEKARVERNMREYGGTYTPGAGYSGEAKDYRPINIRKITGQFMASLLFNEKFSYEIPDESELKEPGYNAQSFIEQVFDDNDFKQRLADMIESAMATGGIACRPYVDPVSKRVHFSWAHADAFFPLKSNSAGISEGVMKTVTTKTEDKKQVYYTLLEFHTWTNEGYYRIANELYRSETLGEPGERVTLSRIYPDLEEVTEYENLTQPQFSYLKPAINNNLALHSPLGLGLVDNAKGTVERLNDAIDAFGWEVAMGERTVMISDELLNYRPDEQGRVSTPEFKPNKRVYKQVTMGQDDKEKIKDLTRDIRVEQFRATIEMQLSTLEMELDISPGSFIFNQGGVKTATEIVSENSTTFRTRNRHLINLDRFIRSIMISVLELAEAEQLFHGNIPDKRDITLTFDDGVFQDDDAILNKWSAVYASGLIPRVEAIKRGLNVTEERALEIAQAREQENTRAQASAVDMSLFDWESDIHNERGE